MSKFDLKYLEKLAKLMTDSELTEVQLEDQEQSIILKREKQQAVVAQSVAPVVQAHVATNDTTGVAQATEIKADIILLGKAIDAVYSADPKIQKDAIRFEEISYLDVLNKDLKVMDSTATAMCRDNNIPLLVFGIADPENIVRAVKGEKIGTIVS